MSAAAGTGGPVFKGVYTAIVTPFDAAGAVDWAAYETFVEAQVASGVAGIVVVRAAHCGG